MVLFSVSLSSFLLAEILHFEFYQRANGFSSFHPHSRSSSSRRHRKTFPQVTFERAKNFNFSRSKTSKKWVFPTTNRHSFSNWKDKFKLNERIRNKHSLKKNLFLFLRKLYNFYSNDSKYLNIINIKLQRFNSNHIRSCIVQQFETIRVQLYRT